MVTILLKNESSHVADPGRGIGSNFILGGLNVAAQLGLERSPVLRLDRCTIFSARTVYARSTWPCIGSPVLESTGALLSPPTQPILEVVFTKPSKDVCLIDIIYSHHVHEICM